MPCNCKPIDKTVCIKMPDDQAVTLKWCARDVRNEFNMPSHFFMHAFIYLDYIHIYTMFTIHDQLKQVTKIESDIVHSCSF